MRHGSIFSGIGGFDLAATWMGWQNLFSCEKDPFCRKVLKFYWPQTHQYEDIYQFDATQYRGLVDIISGGFPCQPFSTAGRRKGKADDRYLWPQARRIITEALPRWIVLENVAGLFSILEPESLSEMEIKAIELFCSDSEQKANSTIIRLQRRVIGTIISEIKSAGYILPQMEDGTPIVLCIPACAVNAPHRRDRVWFVAQHHSVGENGCTSGNVGNCQPNEQGQTTYGSFHQGRTDYDRGAAWPDTDGHSNGQHRSDRTYEIFSGQRGQYDCHDVMQTNRYAANADSQGLERPAGERFAYSIKPAWFGKVPDWNQWPAQSPVCGRNDGLSGKLDGITFSKWRSESIKGFGNAIVPQIAFELFKSIETADQRFY